MHQNSDTGAGTFLSAIVHEPGQGTRSQIFGGIHCVPLAALKIANKIAAALGAELVKQRPR
jgi:hypothetical protein